MTAEQLALFDDGQLDPPATTNGHDDLFEAVRRLVAEPGMDEAEVRAVVEDALEQLGWTPDAPLRPAPCRCEPSGQALWGPLCWRCGRPPGPATGPVYVKPIGATPLREKHP